MIDKRIIIGAVGLVIACSPEPFPEGPCNEDGDTGEPAAGPNDAIEPTFIGPHPDPEHPGELHPGTPNLAGWRAPTRSLDGLYRHSTPDENRRFGWPDHTLLVATLATPLELEDAGQRAWISAPRWVEREQRWQADGEQEIRFHRHELREVQELALGQFVEHRPSLDTVTHQPIVRRPTFKLYGQSSSDVRTRVLADSTQAFVLQSMTEQGATTASFPHGRRELEVAPPPGYDVTVFSPSPPRDIMRDPLTPFSCENGECEDPNDPLDECNDGIDNDGDGHADLCDWNCLPHADFGANNFPEARSRVENGKAYALMGGGSICTDLQDTWMVEFADMALQASELFRDIRPDVDEPVRFRVFSCWVFENDEAFELCQHGPFEVIGEDVIYGDPVCPPGMENYPYGPTEWEQQPDYGDQATLLFEEATARAWIDLELNTLALGALGEPMNGVIFLTTNTLQTCLEDDFPACELVAGRAVGLEGDPNEWGSAVVTNANDYDWHTLAHEVGHTLGLEHDDVAEGFMNDLFSGGVLPLLGITRANPLVDNNAIWDRAMSRKGSHPRSSGWRHTFCNGPDECAPLGKPGWSCNGAWCEPD